MRSTTEVFNDHLSKRLAGDVNGDISNNYAEDVIFLTGTGAYFGHEGVRESADELANYIGDMPFEYNHTLIKENYAFLEWTATSQDKKVYDGADSFVIKNDKIIFQSIHYTVSSTPNSEK